MAGQNPILITSAAGDCGGVSRTMVDMLLERGNAVQAFVRRDDDRARSVRQAGAEVFVGDLLSKGSHRLLVASPALCRVYVPMSF